MKEKVEEQISSFMIPTYQTTIDKEILVNKLDILFRRYSVIEKSENINKNELDALKKGFYSIFSEYPEDTVSYIQEASKITAENSLFMQAAKEIMTMPLHRCYIVG